MPIYTGTISGQGEASFSSNRPTYLLWDVVTLGAGVQSLDPLNTDRLAKFGWVSFFYHQDPGGEFDKKFYDEPIWLNWLQGRWQTYPATSGGAGQLMIFGDGIRWSISLGSSVYIEVGG